ncbi:hypothetical protein J2795_004573 [Chryseobacterium bernardetii]|uniref:PH (Pleckstrin Homology) domain-containing protein n=2 Tax=Chryseobacterium TaxID=59732 RepID=A0A543E9X3_9FLAO|nr:MULTISPECIES: hypothetical protein [Chryseobacterium]MDR6371889.1 hypothetical protein [Chryseobacterium vietnamense]MDR6443821.1 hypothetical protein [Chryseobacterium bernardetii]TQM18378.1 hypothetical protein FB551_4160 [Chryseobacterium aquifrigidense]
MDIRDRYKFEENGSEISFMPNYSFLRTLVWWLGLGILALPVILYYFKGKVSGDQFKIAIGLWAIYMIYFLFDLLFRIPVKYIFDKSEKCIYRKLLLSKRLMNFDEMTYFVNDERGGYYYSIGKKRNQFVKNYRISNYFSGSKASDRREDEYIKEILCPVLIAVGIPLNQPEQ